MQYHLCVCILGHAKPQNWFDPGVGRYCIMYSTIFRSGQ